jgi:hypothetical protein
MEKFQRGMSRYIISGNCNGAESVLSIKDIGMTIGAYLITHPHSSFWLVQLKIGCIEGWSVDQIGFQWSPSSGNGVLRR